MNRKFDRIMTIGISTKAFGDVKSSEPNAESGTGAKNACNSYFVDRRLKVTTLVAER
ncbi:MAG: hypothetical protein PHE96_10440 [Methylococcales bacterium]|nr:hypothetical protein [Methylococcales bacterium]